MARRKEARRRVVVTSGHLEEVVNREVGPLERLRQIVPSHRGGYIIVIDREPDREAHRTGGC